MFKLCYIYNTNYLAQWWRKGTKCDGKSDWLWVRFSLEYLLKFIFSFLRSGVEATLSFALQSLAEIGKWSVLTPGFLCLPYCVRDTA